MSSKASVAYDDGDLGRAFTISALLGETATSRIWFVC